MCMCVCVSVCVHYMRANAKRGHKSTWGPLGLELQVFGSLIYSVVASNQMQGSCKGSKCSATEPSLQPHILVLPLQ